MKVNIRPLTREDRNTWEKLFGEYAQFYETSVPEGGLDAVWQWIFDPDNAFWCDLAENSAGEVIGFTQYQLMHRSLSGTMICYLSDLYVDPEVRGTGAGRAMIDHVLEFARNRGLSGVRWLTQEGNLTARRLYDTYHSKSDFILYSVPV